MKEELFVCAFLFFTRCRTHVHRSTWWRWEKNRDRLLSQFIIIIQNSTSSFTPAEIQNESSASEEIKMKQEDSAQAASRRRSRSMRMDRHKIYYTYINWQGSLWRSGSGWKWIFFWQRPDIVGGKEKMNGRVCVRASVSFFSFLNCP